MTSTKIFHTNEIIYQSIESALSQPPGASPSPLLLCPRIGTQAFRVHPGYTTEARRKVGGMTNARRNQITPVPVMVLVYLDRGQDFEAHLDQGSKS